MSSEAISAITNANNAQTPQPTTSSWAQRASDASFAETLGQVANAFTRRQTQTAFLRNGSGNQTLPFSQAVDEQARLMVMRNSAAGYQVGANDNNSATPAFAKLPAANPETPESLPTPVLPETLLSDVPETKTTTGKLETPNTDINLPALSLEDYPHPAGDNGRGIHWIPTLSSDKDTVDTYVKKAVDMGVKWVVFLNSGTNLTDNEYLVKRLVDNGIMPIMRVFTDGLKPVEGDLGALVKHYKSLGVTYFQLYNEPNLMVETGGKQPDVSSYLDLWIPEAKEVIAAGGLPGIGALSPQGEVDDRQYLAAMLDELKARGETDLLDRSWLASHNYTGARPMNDPDGFLRFRQYDAIVKQKLGRSLPIIGTEGGTHVSSAVSEQTQVNMVVDAYKYMAKQREPYNFAYTYWIIANEAGGGKDAAFADHALYRTDGPTALARALSSLA